MSTPTVTEGWFEPGDGGKLYTKTWMPSQSPTAHIIFVHGFSDHINAYYDLFPTLSSPPYNIAINGFDQRGWGRSVHTPSDRGLTGPTPTVLQDMHNFSRHVASSLLPNTPLFLMAHSMGGGQALLYLLSQDPAFYPNQPTFAGLILESPLITLSFTPNPLVVFAGRMAARVLPHMQMKQVLDAADMSRSEKVWRDWVEDPLCHDTGTLEGLRGMLDRTTDLTRMAEGRDVPGYARVLPKGCALWVGHGNVDKVNSWDASRRVVENVEVNGDGGDGDKKVFKTYEGAYHKLHAEPEGVGEEFVKDVGEWIMRRVERMKQNGEKEAKPKL